MSVMEITSSSTKGQIVIPRKIRSELGITPGTKLVMVTDGKNLLMKPIREPRISSFKKLIAESEKFAREVDLKPEDIKEAIKAARGERDY